MHEREPSPHCKTRFFLNNGGDNPIKSKNTFEVKLSNWKQAKGLFCAVFTKETC